MIRLLVVAASLAFAMPAAAQDLWRHEASGISIPRTVGEMSLGQERDLSGGAGTDVTLQYGDSDTPVTLYVYRSAFPNAALWFERTRHAMNVNVGSDTAPAAPRPFTLGGASAPNGLREEISLRGDMSTAVAIAQIGEWIVKARITGALDRAAITARMDRLLGALRFAQPVPTPLPLAVPGACGDEVRMNGRRVERIGEREQATALMFAVSGDAEARGSSGLAREPQSWCRITQTRLPAQIIGLYRRNDGTGWVALLGDSGRAASAMAGDSDERRIGLVASTPSATHAVAIYDGLPDPEAALNVALPAAMGRATGIASVGAGAPKD